MKKEHCVIRFRQLIAFLLAIILITLSACAQDMETLEKNVNSGDPKVVDRSVKQLMKILEDAQGDNSSPLYEENENHTQALKVIVANMKDIPQCNKAIVELLKAKYNVWDVTYCAREYLDLSLFDDETITAFALYGNEHSYFSRFLDNVPIPTEYEKIISASSKYSNNSMKYNIGKAVVFRGVDDQYYNLDAMTFTMPDEHRISLSNLGNADTVIKICDYKIAEGVYRNNNEGGFTNDKTAYRINTVLAIYDTKTQRLVYSVTFEGGDPPELITEYESGNGPSISSNKIMEYLTTHNFTF